MSILVITTGGTIGAMRYEDLRRQPIIKTMPADGTDIVRILMEKDFSQYDLRFITLEHRDSNFIDWAYRENIRQIIEQSAESNILITHGTDTILTTAEFFYWQNEKSEVLRNKVILLTGSMVALSCGEESDGFQNISFALKELSRPLTAGVYIVLSDYEDVTAQSGWKPRLYPFVPGKYGKTHDADNMNRDRVFVL